MQRYAALLRYYRNLPLPVSEYWTQAQWLGPDGIQLDLFTCFGDGAAPAQSNKVQDIFLRIAGSSAEAPTHTGPQLYSGHSATA